MDVLFWRGRHKVSDEDLSAYVDGELSVSATQRVEAHLEDCAACREAISELRAVRQSVKELPRVSAPRSFVLREADVVAEHTTGATGLFGSATPLLSGVAAIALVAFVVLAGFDITSESSDSFAGRTAGDFDTGLAMESADQAPPERSFDLDDEDGDTIDGASEDLAAVGEFTPGPDAVTDGEARLGSRPQNDLAPGGDDEMGLRIAEAVAGGVAVIAGGAALLLWWRRRAASA